MRSIFISGIAALSALGASHMSQAVEHDDMSRFYGGLSLGASRLDQSDEHGSVFKLYGGYQITDNFGAEVGFLRNGNVERTTRIGGQSVQQNAKNRAFYTAGTARWQFSDRFSVNGLMGVAHTEVSGDDTAGSQNLNRENTSVILGLGAQYRLTPRIAVTFNADHLADVTEESASTDLVTAGVLFKF